MDEKVVPSLDPRISNRVGSFSGASSPEVMVKEVRTRALANWTVTLRGLDEVASSQHHLLVGPTRLSKTLNAPPGPKFGLLFEVMLVQFQEGSLAPAAGLPSFS